MNFPLSSNQNKKGCFPDVSHVQLAAFLRNFRRFVLLGKAELSMASCIYIDQKKEF